MSKKKQQNPKEKALSPQHMAALTNMENAGTAMLQAGQQMFLAVEQVLKEEFNFNPEQLQHFERRITAMMEALAFVEDRGLSAQTIDSMNHVSKVASYIASVKQKKLAQEKNGIVLPSGVSLDKLGN